MSLFAPEIHPFCSKYPNNCIILPQFLSELRQNGHYSGYFFTKRVYFLLKKRHLPALLVLKGGTHMGSSGAHMLAASLTHQNQSVTCTRTRAARVRTQNPAQQAGLNTGFLWTLFALVLLVHVLHWFWAVFEVFGRWILWVNGRSTVRQPGRRSVRNSPLSWTIPCAPLYAPGLLHVHVHARPWFPDPTSGPQ